MKKFAVILLATILVLGSFAACANSGNTHDAALSPSEGYSKSESPNGIDPMPSSPVDYDGSTEKPTAGLSSSGAIDAEKIVYTANYTIETKEFDSAMEKIVALVKQFGGFIESSSVNGNTYYEYNRTYLRNRYANYTLRIPSQRFEEFLNTTGDIGSVTRKSQDAANISSQYTDVDSRLQSYRITEERLLDLLSRADQMSDILQLESKLSDVRYQIDYLQRQLYNMDASVNFSTVYLYLREVEIYTPIEKESFFTRVGDAFVAGWTGFAEGLGNFSVWFVEAFPVLLLIAAACVVIVIVIKKIVKKHKKPVDKA